MLTFPAPKLKIDYFVGHQRLPQPHKQMYRAGIEFILGIRREGSQLAIDPCIPPAWKEFKVHYRHGKSKYHIQVMNPVGCSKCVAKIIIDGQITSRSDGIPLDDSGGDHLVVVTMDR